MMTRPIGGDDERARARPSTDSRPIDDRSRPSSRRHPPARIVATEDSSFDRAIGPSVGRWNGMEWNGMEWMGTTSIPQRHTYRQTDTYIHDNRPIIIYYIQRARDDRPTRPTTTDATSRARDVTRRRRLPSTLECRRRDAGLERRRRNERTNERVSRVSVGDDDAEGRRRRRRRDRRSTRDVDEGATRPRMTTPRMPMMTTSRDAR